ncbi:single-stranded DNA-binding protein [bacterium]|nr:single-stranded DNA-binding protein [bacterium]
MYINKAILYGNLTRDPELKSLPSGAKVATFGLATNRTWKDKNGVKQESVTFHNIVTYGQQAELAAQYLKKGSGLFVEGRIENRSWDDQASGQKKYRSEIVVDRFQFGPKSAGGTSSGSFQKSGNSGSGAKEQELDTIEYPEEDIKSEDIPF